MPTPLSPPSSEKEKLQAQLKSFTDECERLKKESDSLKKEREGEAMESEARNGDANKQKAT